MYSLVSFWYLSITCNAVIACDIRCKLLTIYQGVHITYFNSDKLAHVQFLINCLYSVAQMCTWEDTNACLFTRTILGNLYDWFSQSYSIVLLLRHCQFTTMLPCFTERKINSLHIQSSTYKEFYKDSVYL